jgi:hypothetical protein
MLLSLQRDLFGKPASTPDQSGAGFFRIVLLVPQG